MAISYNPSIVVSGLSFCSDAANIKCYNSGISTTNWNDLTSTVGVGSLTNGATFNSSNLGNITFDGTNDYASVPINLSSSKRSPQNGRATASHNSKRGASPLSYRRAFGGFRPFEGTRLQGFRVGC